MTSKCINLEKKTVNYFRLSISIQLNLSPSYEEVASAQLRPLVS